MSSKTTFKRVALVAVAALSLGVLSVAPSSATINADSLTLSAATAAQTTAETATATSAVATASFLGATGDSLTVTASLVSGPAGNTALPYMTLSETSSATVSATSISPNAAVSVQAISGSAATTAKFKVYLGTSATAAPTVAGTYVVKLTPATVGSSGALQAAAAQTLTITVTTAAALDTVAASATSIINAGETNTATTDNVVTASKSVSASTAAATIKVSLLNAAGSAVTAESFTAVISGPGTLGSAVDFTSGATGRAITVKNGDLVGVFADGTSGVSTITISSAAGKILATETVTFFGAATTLVATVKKAVIGGTTAVADVLAVSAKDAAGVDVSNLTSFGVVSSDTTKIATLYGTAKGSYDATTGLYLIPVTPVAAGSSNITVTTNASAADTTGVSAAAVAVRVGSKTPASLKVTLDKTSYLPGEKATITVALADSTALDLVSSETYTAIFATGGITSNYSLGNGSATISGTDVISYASAGKAYTVFMPIMDGDIAFSWTSGTGVATANQGVAGSITVRVSPSSSAADAATDAANEATDAANAATDAALAAADAADAATAAAQDASDAVAALSATVAKLVASLKAQITSLTNLVIKIQKKVKA